MTEREDNVYKAKLAEQGERYDGNFYHFYSAFLAMMSLFAILERYLN